MSAAPLPSEGSYCLPRARVRSPAETEGRDEGPELRLRRCSELGWRLGGYWRLTVLCGFPPTDFLQQCSSRWQCRASTESLRAMFGGQA